MTNTDNKESIVKTVGTEKRARKVVGRVTSDKADKSAVVSIERVVKHGMYGKYIRRTTKLFAHDETNQCKLGDEVELEECRPVSKRKSWRVVQILQSGKSG
jgi:small subunit ribosomal protein S17|tara:strand:+ start:432 stop:734 length:303 start_codon:yes stop_codon:yes gene_type:complete